MRLSLSTTHGGQGVTLQTPTQTSASSLTPPVTPIGKEAGDPERSIPSPLEETNSEQTAAQVKRNVITPLRFSDDVEICRDSADRPIEFGRGAWSIVYKARSIPSAPAANLHTPPSSPITTSRILAVKAPLRRDARKVLQAEALTLTRLNLTPGYEQHVVPFHGLLSDSDALVMSAVPLALSTYIEDQADLRKKQPSTATMYDPVQGPDSWRDMARKLISGLAWLHDTAGIIHGDIKPHNVLLRSIAADESAFPHEPLLADFSSAIAIPSDSAQTPDPNHAAMSAFTPPFTAPELLTLASLKSGDVLSTPASDVFSLAATLIAAATGDLLLYPSANKMQRLAMARDGHRILDFTRSGSNGCRVPCRGFVEKLTQPAVAKDPTQRIPTQNWLVLASS
ncbi:uncharacterized protein N7482_009792 [Penicillium canariense]|uniref:Protein kinase domain-containing protein n=1 Tax=Penicillium canariense TaxID=189055 RepID=A0A9W9HTV3_9EURO|nr:uncharacterized protein N7482_009792 [Penicillium canariense]KAJ5153314.1 hypothetical protein N7482_009792 [Penicillium canariense]